MNKQIGVIGAGVMGKGVAQRFARFGYKVIMVDINDDILFNSIDEITKSLGVAKMFDRNIDVLDIINRITVTTSYDDLKDVDFIVENVPEKQNIKEAVYQMLDKVCKESCIYMVNTSCIPITLTASFTNRADRIIGVHFMNPVPLKKFAEVIRGYHTADQTVQEVKGLLNSVGISIEVINDSAGFVSNRLSHLFMNEAAFLVHENVATAQQIDNIFKEAFGHKMGPLETADLIGLDTILDSLKILYTHYEDSKFRACPLLKQMVYSGKKGRKSGKGFYQY